MVDSPHPKSKRRSLKQLVDRALLQSDTPALLALCRGLADRLLDADDVHRILSGDERTSLHAVMGMSVAPVLPPGPAVPLSAMQARLLGVLEIAGSSGMKTNDLIAKLWPAGVADGKDSLRRLLRTTNKKLKQCDPHRRRIYRQPRDVLRVKKTGQK